jgi:hypothetical protein
MFQPYPSELAWWPDFTTELESLYATAGIPLDSGRFLWYTRTAYDIGSGLEKEKSKKKHLNELRVELGLPVEPDPVITLSRLITAGQFFQLETGQRFTAIQCSDFNLYNRFLNGENIEPILQQRQDCGFNMLRVWTLFDLEAANIGKLLLSDHPELYSRLLEFCQLAARYGLYIEFTAYTSTWEPNHWQNLTTGLLGATNAIVELVNEEDQPANDIDTSLFSSVPGLLCSHGSNGSQAWPVEPYWDYVTFHTNGAPEEQRKIGHNAWEIWSGPSLTNETSRFPDVGMWEGGSNLNRIKQLAYDSAAGAALLCAGSCFHSKNGKNSTLWEGNELEAAKSWAAGAKSVDLACQAGPYVHRTDLETSGILRAYERPVAGHNGIVIIHE